MPFNLKDFLRQSLKGLVNTDIMVPLVSLYLFFVCSSTYFPGEKLALLRALLPINGNGGAIIERRWVDEHGNPASYRITTWVGIPPPGAEGLEDRGENLA